jgi:hypothetical protein
MVFLHIRTREPFSTAGAESLNLSQMCLVHMASAVLLPDKFRASGPSALYSVLTASHNGERELWVRFG